MGWGGQRAWWEDYMFELVLEGWEIDLDSFLWEMKNSQCCIFSFLDFYFYAVETLVQELCKLAIFKANVTRDLG